MTAAAAAARIRCVLRVTALAAVLAPGVMPQRATGQGAPPAPVRIAVFDFELEDLSPASTLLNASTSSSAALERATRAAREALQSSGRYSVVDGAETSTATPPPGGWHGCDGCEAAAAARLAADQSLLGMVRRATQTDYYVIVQIRDAHTGKLLDQQAANFAGDETGWASGVRMLMKHQVLAIDSPAEPTPASLSDAPAAARTATESSPSPAPPLCKLATVSPVSGFAECVDPPGAPVLPLSQP